MRISRELLESDECQRIYSIAKALPADAAISGRAAASLMGVRWFDGDQKVLVIRALDTSRVRRPGVTTRRTNLDESETTTIRGVRVTSPQQTAFELLRTPPLPDAVAAVDAMLHAGLVTIEELMTAVDAHPRWRSVRIGATIAPSPRWRSRITDGVAPEADPGPGGLPRPLVNVPLYDSHTGASLGRPDLLDVEAGVVVEYDGAHHRDPVSIAPTTLANRRWRKLAW